MKDNHSKQGALDNPISAWVLGDRLKVAADMVSSNIKSILDIGCGEGHFIRIVLGRYPYAKLVGLDISEENMDYAKKLVPKAKFVVGDASELPFRNRSFDCIVLLEVLDHCENVDVVLSEIRRVLKKNGELILSVPDTSKEMWNFMWYFWTRSIGRRWLELHKRNFNEESLRRFMDTNGFRVSEVRRAFFGFIMTIKAKPKD
jgi:ubiquinone/menaquinone biosynthesis C-methylase UbiE